MWDVVVGCRGGKCLEEVGRRWSPTPEGSKLPKQAGPPKPNRLFLFFRRSRDSILSGKEHNSEGMSGLTCLGEFFARDEKEI
jgi:hypothetical protein